MNKRLVLIANRRLILEKIEIQRMQVAEISARWQMPLALANAGLKAVRFVRRHPAWVSGGLAAFMTWRRKGIAGLAGEGWRLLCLYPSSLALGLEYLFLENRPQTAEELLAGHPDECDTEADD